MDDEPRLHAETIAEFADWLAANHDRARAVWLVTWGSATGRPAPSYEDAVLEALRWGWIDSTQRRLDDERSMQRFSPRRPGSGWASTNKARIARLEAEGRLEAPGRAAVERARADGSWTILDAVEALEVPDDLAAAFDVHPGSRDHWESFPPSARRQLLWWVVQARRPDTRRRRITEVAEKAARGERAAGA